MKFEWDEAKAEANARKHGVSFFEATEVFDGNLSCTFYDRTHSDSEDRFITIGFAASGRILVVVHSDRDDDNIVRIISARPANRREIKEYGDGLPPNKPAAADETMSDDYDFRSLGPAVRGKYAQQYRAQEPCVRILRNDGIVEEGPLSKMRTRFELSKVPADVATKGDDVTFVAVPNELVPKVQELIAHAQNH